MATLDRLHRLQAYMSEHNLPETIDGLVERLAGPLDNVVFDTYNVVTYDVSALDPTGQVIARKALAAWDDVLPFDIVPVDMAPVSDQEYRLVFQNTEEPVSYVHGTGLPSDGVIQAYIEIAVAERFHLPTYLHEIGHVFRLRHPDDYEQYSEPRFALDSYLTTVMSYHKANDNMHLKHPDSGRYDDLYPTTPAIADIIAVQTLYGKPDAVRGGDTRYGYESNITGYLDDVLAALTHRHSPFSHVDTGSWSNPTLVDLDNDGDADLAVHGNETDKGIDYYENTGDGVRPAYTPRTGGDNPLAAVGDGIYFSGGTAFADMDNDGDLDLILTHFEYYENVGDAGQPVFSLRTGQGNPLHGITQSIRIASQIKPVDLDNDNDFDLVLVDEDWAIRYIENTGAPAFTIRDGEDNPFSGIDVVNPEHTLGDVDKDGDLDLLVGNADGHLLYLENIGTATAPVFILQGTGRAVALTLYDTGGIDTLDFSNDRDSQRLDLREEGISDVYGVRGNLVIARGTVIENAVAGRGDDTLIGGDADNVLEGGPGADSLSGGPGQDTASYAGSPEGVTVRLHSLSAAGGDAEGDSFPYTVDVTYRDAEGLEQTESLPDVENLIGSAHNDTLAGDRRDNVIDGGAGNDTLYGGPGGGDDVLAGGPGNDRLYGGLGADRLTGGPGDDRLAGGPGADVFVFAPGDGADTVTDFSAGTDKIDLTGFDIERVEDVMDAMTPGGDGVTIDLADIGGGTVLLADLTALPEAGDFLV